MKLEDEIKVKQFRNQRHKLNVNLIYTYNWMIAQMREGMRASGITMQQYNILRILRGQSPNPSTIQLLKDRMLDKQPDASRLVDRLSQKELVRRHVCKDDRRKMDVFISEKGLELLDKLQPMLEDFEGLMGSLDDNEVEQMNEMLDKMRDVSVN